MKWEYKTIKLPQNGLFIEDKPSFEAKQIDNFINDLGKNGWELVSVEGIIGSSNFNFEMQSIDTTVLVFFFKRPLAE